MDVVPVEPAARDLGEAVEVRYVVSVVSLANIQKVFMKEGALEYVRSEEGGEKVSNDTADTVLPEDIKRIVNTDNILQLRGIIAADRAHDTENNS